ncbi:MAG: tRNA pseudouridine(13) synthase TruD [Candidatus Bathyarchaeota archaeon]|nr:tRNA pseudouridine(13) synthase TruD [Candidatus Bathyarchaeota archaeon]
MFVPRVEKLIGIEVYATASSGIGGVIRQSVEDFVVEEVLVDGSKAEISRTMEHQTLGASSTKDRYLLCVMVKRNWDTFQAIRMIAEQLGISTGQIRIAGIKDAKALTAQHITIENATTEKVQQIKVKDIEIHPIGYFRSKLSPYYLLGNSFNIKIKAISHSETTIKKRTAKIVEELKAIGGIPNFFGHQRFGTTRPITHFVGKALVKGNFKKAAMLFLAKPSPYEHPESRQARKDLQATQDFKQALKNFPKQLRYERLMLRHLIQKPDDFVGAFRQLPTKLRLLFPQAYQSYLFNKFLSKRITSGFAFNKIEAGDYVVNIERSGLPIITMYKIANPQTLNEINKAAATGKMRLALPLIGLKQRTSQGIQGEIEKRILEEEGITQKNFKIKAMPETTTKGELRAAITPLNNFSLNKVEKDFADSLKNIAKVSFMLYRGSYATILLREIMKPRNPIKAGF